MRDRHHVSGIREPLPDGEHLVWEGRPDRRRLLSDVFGARVFIGYFAVLGLLAVFRGGGSVAARVAWIAVLAVAFWAILATWAILVERTTLYSVTNRRILIRKGISLPSVLNLPFSRVANLSWGARDDGTGDIVIDLTGGHLLWPLLWPHVRPWKFRRPDPALRAIPDVAEAAEALREAYGDFLAAGGRAEVQLRPAELRLLDEDDTVVLGGPPPREATG